MPGYQVEVAPDALHFVDADWPLRSHGDMSQLLEELVPGSRHVLARPERAADGQILWADPLGGEITGPMSELPDSERAEAEQKLREMLTRIEAACVNHPRRQELLAATTVYGPRSLATVGSRPVLAGWGSAPPETLTEAGAIAHHNATIGPFSTRSARKFELLGSPNVRRVPPGWPKAASIAAGLSGLLLFLLLLPGVLRALFPTEIVQVPRLEPSEANLVLQREISAYEALLENGVCTPDGSYAVEPQLVPAVPIEDTAPLPAAPDITLPEPPANTILPPLPDGTTTGDFSNLGALLDAATFLIITPDGIGTGFKVADGLILTNHHVVKDHPQILIGNPGLGRMVRGTVTAKTASFGNIQPDFALISAPEIASSFPNLEFSNAVQRGQNAVAYGYPVAVMRTDSVFQDAVERLRRAEQVDTIPQAVPTFGRVMHRQTPTAAASVILHRANISPGNSGGPLTDECGRVLGVNTFLIESEDSGSLQIYYALAATDALEFLRSNGVLITASDQQCGRTSDVEAE